MRSATAAPVSVSSFSIRAKGSTMKLSSNRVAVPEPLATKTPATTRTRIASHSTSSPLSRLVATPSMSNAMAPPARMISGRARPRGSDWSRGRGSLRHQREPRLLGGGKACMVVLDQRIDRSGGRIENGPGVEAEKDREGDERRHHHDLAPGEVGDEFQAHLFELPENDAPIEPEGIGRRQDHARGGEEGDPGVDAEGAGEAQDI